MLQQAIICVLYANAKQSGTITYYNSLIANPPDTTARFSRIVQSVYAYLQHDYAHLHSSL